MDEKFEQCSEKNSTEKVTDLAVSNQETPEDYKNKVARNTEARKLGSSARPQAPSIYQRLV